MTITTPSLTTITQSAATAISTRLSGADATPPRSLLGILGTKVLPGAVDGLYGAIEKVAANIIYDTASEDYLVRYAGFWGITRDKPTSATGPVIFSGTSGKTVSEGALMSRSDGLQYKLSALVTLANGTGTGTVTCTSAGSVTNTDAGGTLTLTSSVTGVSTTVTVGADGLSDGADIESIASLLAKLVARLQKTPQGGDDGDYEKWAKTISGVTRVWVYKWWLGTGTIGITFMMDGRDDPIPLAADVAAVQAAIDAEYPTGARAFVFAPTAVPLPFTIHLNPDSTAIRTAVTAELASLIANQCTPGGTYIVDGLPVSGGLLYLTHIDASISAAAGEDDYTLTTPTANVSVLKGSITTLGEITWM
jgi:uncharacterized phage protein gp47/JayE